MFCHNHNGDDACSTSEHLDTNGVLSAPLQPLSINEESSASLVTVVDPVQEAEKEEEQKYCYGCCVTGFAQQAEVPELETEHNYYHCKNTFLCGAIDHNLA